MAQQTENNNMTAVEWFHDKVDDLISDGLRERIELLKNEAKQMEKEQIIMAHCHNRCLNNKTYECSIKAFENAEQYYNETYGTK